MSRHQQIPYRNPTAHSSRAYALQEQHDPQYFNTYMRTWPGATSGHALAEQRSHAVSIISHYSCATNEMPLKNQYRKLNVFSTRNHLQPLT